MTDHTLNDAAFDPAYVMAVCERRHREGLYGPIFLTLDQQLALATLAAYSVKNRIDAWDEGFAAGYEVGNVEGWNNGRGDDEEMLAPTNPYRVAPLATVEDER